MADEKLTLRQAAARLGVSESAIRKRVERGTLRSDKGADGKRYVYLDTGADRVADTGADTSATHEPDALISELRAHNATLREQLEQANERDRETRRIIAALTSRIPAIEAPAEASEASVNASSTAERRAVGEAPVGRKQAAERSQQRSGWRAPVEKLPWWNYGLGLLLVFLGAYLAVYMQDAINELGMMSFRAILLLRLLILVIALLPPSVFGIWVGFRKNDPRLRTEAMRSGVLVVVAFALATLSSYIQRNLSSRATLKELFLYDPPWGSPVAIIVVVFAGWLLYMSGALIGNALQRHLTGRISGTTPVSPLSRGTRASLEPHADWTPRQQAILGWSGQVIAALLGGIAAIIAATMG